MKTSEFFFARLIFFGLIRTVNISERSTRSSVKLFSIKILESSSSLVTLRKLTTRSSMFFSIRSSFALSMSQQGTPGKNRRVKFDTRTGSYVPMVKNFKSSSGVNSFFFTATSDAAWSSLPVSDLLRGVVFADPLALFFEPPFLGLLAFFCWGRG